jgi:hypothetical protein
MWSLKRTRKNCVIQDTTQYEKWKEKNGITTIKNEDVKNLPQPNYRQIVNCEQRIEN